MSWGKTSPHYCFFLETEEADWRSPGAPCDSWPAGLGRKVQWGGNERGCSKEPFDLSMGSFIEGGLGFGLDLGSTKFASEIKGVLCKHPVVSLARLFPHVLYIKAIFLLKIIY